MPFAYIPDWRPDGTEMLLIPDLTDSNRAEVERFAGFGFRTQRLLLSVRGEECFPFTIRTQYATPDITPNRVNVPSAAVFIRRGESNLPQIH